MNLLAAAATFLITWYCNDRVCTGKDHLHPAWGLTATGRHSEGGLTAACDPSMKGNVILIDGIGPRVCYDTGGAIKGKRIDVYIESHDAALKLGKSYRRVKILRKGTSNGKSNRRRAQGSKPSAAPDRYPSKLQDNKRSR